MRYVIPVLIVVLIFSFTFRDIQPNIDAFASVLKIYTDSDGWVSLPTVTATAAGDMLYRNDTGAGAFGLIAKGSDNDVLTMDGNYPNWEAGGGAGDVTSAANITEHSIVRGADGAKGVELSTVFISDAGEMTNTSQPSFQVVPTSTQTNIAVGSDVTVVFGTERWDNGNDFASNTFTAPVTGKYLIAVNLYMQQLDSGATNYYMKVLSSNKTYYSGFSVNRFSGDLDFWSMVFSEIIDLDQSDTIYVAIVQTDGAQQADVNSLSRFSGSLLH